MKPILHVIHWPIPYEIEVRLQQRVMNLLNDLQNVREQLEDALEIHERLRRMLGGRLPTDGTYGVSFIDGGELSRQINEGLAVIASDIYRRTSIDEPRKLTVSIKGEPSENSSAVKWDYETTINLAKSKGNGIAYLDKDGKLQNPECVGVEQIMLPIDALVSVSVGQ